MKKLAFIYRILTISYIILKHRLDRHIASIPFFRALRFVVYLNPLNWFSQRKQPVAKSLCLALEELGPIYIKFGQALSTRQDLIPAEYIKELSRLQDNVASFCPKIAKDIVKKTFNQCPDELFKHFDEKPLASASISQVHAATLHSGEEVVVKILRPNVHYLIRRDLNIMHMIAAILERYWPLAQQVKPQEVVNEFEHSLIDELDLMREAANASQLKRNFQGSELLYVPEVYWNYTRNNILVMERISGIPISNIEEIKRQGIDLKKLARVSIDIFFTQMLKHSFFHADMHPGNIFVNPGKKDTPQYICVDFGIIGTLTDEDKRYLAENLRAFFNRDYRRVALLHIESGWVPKDTRVTEFESAIRTVCEPIFEKPFKEISFGQVLLRLFQTGRRFHMEVQPQLILLQKTLLAVEGLGRQIDPDLNLWDTAKPFIEKWIKEQMGVKALVKNINDNLPFITEQLPHVPKLLNDVLVQQKHLNDRQLEALKLKPRKRWPFGLKLGAALFSLPLIGLLLVHLINFEKLEILGVTVSAIGALMIISSLTKT